MASQAFMLSPAEDGRVQSESTFLSLLAWRSALDSVGLRRVLELPEPGHPLDRLGHRVFAAAAKLDRVPLEPARLYERLAPSPARCRIEIVDALPLMEGGLVDRERLSVWTQLASARSPRKFCSASSRGGPE